MATERARPRDVSTVVSILPYQLEERKPGLIPGVFRFPKVEKGDFFLLSVERCVHPVYLDEARPRLIVPDPSDMVAMSIVNDHKASVHGYVPDVAEPGIAWVYGEWGNTEEGKKRFKAEQAALLTDMVRKQEAWFNTVIQLADDDWSRYHRHSFITPIQKHAALYFGLAKDWLIEQDIKEAMSRCKFCFQMIDPRATICAHCHGDQSKDQYQNVMTGFTPAPPAVTPAK